MIKHFLSAMVIMLITMTSSGQTTKQKLDQVKTDPKTVENAAKADSRLIDKKNVADASTKNIIIIKRKPRLPIQKKK